MKLMQPSNKVTQLCYMSLSKSGLSKTDFVGILSEAIIKNAKMSVSGFLICARNHFYQVLEGPQDAVESIFESINNDKRHNNLRVLCQKQINSRSCFSCPMDGFFIENDKGNNGWIVSTIEAVSSLIGTELQADDIKDNLRTDVLAAYNNLLFRTAELCYLSAGPWVASEPN